MAIRVGCSGWSYDHWREPVYERAPPRTWLERYADRFDTVEINSTFYRLPRRSAVSGWADQTPDGFCFAVKVSRYLTHIRRLVDVGGGFEQLLERIEPLINAGKLGPLLWQLPGTFRRDDARLSSALAGLPRRFRHGVEFRHPSWFAPDVMDILREHDAALVIGDHPERPFQTTVRTAGWSYVRFHHGHRGRRGNYSDRELESWARRIRPWTRQGDVYAYFNNDWEAFAVSNAEQLARTLAGGRAARPGAAAAAGRHPPVGPTSAARHRRAS
jgi:uncharacterized protein YecE (DUF72 family)